MISMQINKQTNEQTTNVYYILLGQQSGEICT